MASATFARCAGVRFIHDHELTATAQEALPVAIALDPIKAHHGERDHIEDRLARRQPSLQLLGRTRPNHLSGEVELADHVGPPLFAEVWWADHGDLADLAAIKQLPGDQQRLHGFAKPHLIGDQHPGDGLLQGHQQRHQLVGPWLQGHIAEAAERPCASAEFEQQGIPQQQRRTL